MGTETDVYGYVNKPVKLDYFLFAVTRSVVLASLRMRNKPHSMEGRGRDGDCSPPPAQTRTGAINASGSCRREVGDRQRIS